jgi:hypothetical protein
VVLAFLFAEEDNLGQPGTTLQRSRNVSYSILVNNGQSLMVIPMFEHDCQEISHKKFAAASFRSSTKYYERRKEDESVISSILEASQEAQNQV